MQSRRGRTSGTPRHATAPSILFLLTSVFSFYRLHFLSINNSLQKENEVCQTRRYYQSQCRGSAALRHSRGESACCLRDSAAILSLKYLHKILHVLYSNFLLATSLRRLTICPKIITSDEANDAHNDRYTVSVESFRTNQLILANYSLFNTFADIKREPIFQSLSTKMLIIVHLPKS